MHQVERLVDAFQWQGMGDHGVDGDLAVHVPVHDLGHIGATLGAAKGRAFPDAAGHQLEGPCADFLTRFRDADDDALAWRSW